MLKDVSLSIFIFFLSIVTLIGCKFGPEVTALEHKETIEMITFPEKKFAPLPIYTVAGVTFLPHIVRRIVDNKVYFCIRTYTKDNQSTFLIENVFINIENSQIIGTSVYKKNMDIEWEKCFDGFYTNHRVIQEYNYNEIKLLKNEKINYALTISVIKNEKRVTKTISYNIKISKGRYSSW